MNTGGNDRATGNGAAADLWMLRAVRDGVPAFALFGSRENADSFTRLREGGAFVASGSGFILTQHGRMLLATVNEPTEPQPRERTGLEALAVTARAAAKR